MASVSAVPGNQPIAVKIHYDGVNRRSHMQLRDMVPRTLQEQVRTVLDIGLDREFMIERFSDSAGCYVVLENDNISVYRQLYRAAKAKSKLRLRVTLVGQHAGVHKPCPQPASVEDVPDSNRIEQDTPVPQQEPASTPQVQAMAVSHTESTPAMAASAPIPIRGSAATSRTYDLDDSRRATEYANRDEQGKNEFDQLLAMSVQKLSLLEETKRASQVSASPLSHVTDPKDAIAILQKELAQMTGEATGAAQKADASAGMEGLEAVSNDSAASSSVEVSTKAPSACTCPATGLSFAVFCNRCERNVPDVHYHCSTCEDGDFDLCQACVDLGETCAGPDHWLIKRQTVDGQIVNSTTSTMPLKKTSPPRKPVSSARTSSRSTIVGAPSSSVPWKHVGTLRTCNICVEQHPEAHFMHCVVCPDYDICRFCFPKEACNHHPEHEFVPAVKETEFPPVIKSMMSVGRGEIHHAICDNCDKAIIGVRHKCLECPDWDFCNKCIGSAAVLHPSHRFAPIYKQLNDVVRTSARASVHMGICCDGPLCSTGKGYPDYIRGIRYKCAVCNDFDLCANCEASPLTVHNKTHPLIKFKTPVRHVNVTTHENQEGQPIRVMGDHTPTQTTARATQASVPTPNAVAAVKTIIDVKPEPAQPTTTESKQAEKELEVSNPMAISSLVDVVPKAEKQQLEGVFVRETVSDGTIVSPDTVFEQTWVMRNSGKSEWPAGCSIKFTGGDYMGCVNSRQPAGVSELMAASESTTCTSAIAPGGSFSFTVLLRTPTRPGKFTSYWRLTGPSGEKFGDRLWCDVNVRQVKLPQVVQPVEASAEAQAMPVEMGTAEDASDMASSKMIFPKLEKESPEASIHEDRSAVVADSEIKSAASVDDFEECVEDEWDESETGFLTDEEYDILDASDEEYMHELQSQSKSKK